MTTRLEAPQGPLFDLHDDALAAWALQTAHAAGLGKVVEDYPEQLVRAAAGARTTLKAIQSDLSGIEPVGRPTWELS